MTEKKEIKEMNMNENKDNRDVYSAEMVLAEIANHIGPEFVAMPLNGWIAIVSKMKELEEEHNVSFVKELEELQVPVIPISMVPKEESRIITPNEGSRIITPGS